MLLTMLHFSCLPARAWLYLHVQVHNILHRDKGVPRHALDFDRVPMCGVWFKYIDLVSRMAGISGPVHTQTHTGP